MFENEVRLSAVFTCIEMARWGNRLQAKVSNLGHRMGFTSNFYKINWDLRIGMPVNIGISYLLLFINLSRKKRKNVFLEKNTANAPLL